MTAFDADKTPSSSTDPTSTLNAISPTAAASADSIVSLAMARKALTALLYQGMTVNGEDPWHVLLRYLEQQALADTLPPPPPDEWTAEIKQGGAMFKVRVTWALPSPPASPPESLPSVRSGMWANHRLEVDDAIRHKVPHALYGNCRGCRIHSRDFNDHVPEEP